MLHRMCIILALLTTSCSGWRLAEEMQTNNLKTISIPFISGDGSGALTQELANAFERQSTLKYVYNKSDYIIQVTILDKKNRNIGFHAKSSTSVVPWETRKTVLAEVSLIDTTSGKTIIGPSYIESSVVFDHQNYSLNNEINVSSLGQLNDIDTASDVVYIPFYRTLADKIVGYVTNKLFVEKNRSNFIHS